MERNMTTWLGTKHGRMGDYNDLDLSPEDAAPLERKVNDAFATFSRMAIGKASASVLQDPAYSF